VGVCWLYRRFAGRSDGPAHAGRLRDSHGRQLHRVHCPASSPSLCALGDGRNAHARF
jgi:hypothetical protein